MKFTRTEVKNFLKKSHKNFTELEVNLIYSYIRFKDCDIEDIAKIYNGVKAITSRHNTRLYQDMSDTILGLLEESDFSNISIERMTHLLNTLVNCNFKKLTEDELSFFFREIEDRKFSVENVTRLIYGAKDKYILSKDFDKEKRANLISILDKVLYCV